VNRGRDTYTPTRTPRPRRRACLGRRNPPRDAPTHLGKVFSPGGWSAPPGRIAAWNWTPPGGAAPRPDRAPRWVRVWFHVPLADRWAYAWMWRHGAWEVEPAPAANDPP
jgi:hypothetical protein